MPIVTVYESGGRRYQVTTDGEGRLIDRQSLPDFVEEIATEAPAVVNAATQRKSLYELGIATRPNGSSADNPKSIW